MRLQGIVLKHSNVKTNAKIKPWKIVSITIYIFLHNRHDYLYALDRKHCVQRLYRDAILVRRCEPLGRRARHRDL